MNSLTNRLRVAALPVDIRLGDKEANFAAVEHALSIMPQGIDLIVLPELFSTGYTEDKNLLESWAEKSTGPTIDKVKEWSAKYNTAIAGSFLAAICPNLYNRGFFIEPDGEETFYDKRHLFSRSNESSLLRAGDKLVKPIRFRGWNVAMVICYDLRFPAWCRAPKCDYDVLLVPANWPAARAYAWEHLLIARAIENQCAIVGANRSGHDEYGDYDNLSYIFDAKGRAVGIRPKGTEMVVADLDKTELEKFREKFPVSQDSDEFRILI